MLKPTSNIKPNLLALSPIVPIPFENIKIHPDPNSNHAALNEITQIKKDQKKGLLKIFTKSQSEERQALLEAIGKDENWRKILAAVEEEFGFAQIHLAKAERAVVLGTADWETQLSEIEIPAFLTAEQRRMLTYFLPHRAQICGELNLMENCFHAVLGEEITLVFQEPKTEVLEGFEIGNWVVEAAEKVGGQQISRRPNLRIEIGEMEMNRVIDFVAGGRWRRFLEEGLIPNFVPADWDWEIQILVKKDFKQFKISEEERELRIGVNSIVS